jgi:hypothetical protein
MLVCVDYRDDKKRWQKNWEDLGEPIIMTLDDIKADRLPKAAVLVLLHQSAVDNFKDEFASTKSAILSRDTAFLGVVSAGPEQEHVVTDDGRVCMVSTPFFKELSQLAPKVQTLEKRLTTALHESDPQRRISKLTEAWDDFDAQPGMKETLSALAILCQGYLAVYTTHFGNTKPWTTNDNVLRALRKMGCVSENSVDVRSYVKDLGISQDVDSVSNQTYWLGVFGEYSDAQAIQGTCERVRSAVMAEWGGKDDEGVAKFCLSFDKLVERLEGLANAETAFDPDASTIVADMYCAIATRLEGQA